MSTSFNAYVAGLFGDEGQSDCTVVFYCRGHSGGSLPERSIPAESPSAQRGSQPQHSEAPIVPVILQGSSTTSDGQPAKRQKLQHVEDNSQPVPLLDGSVNGAEDMAGCEPAPESELPPGCEVVGDPLPAHRLVLCGGSARFRAQVERRGHGSSSQRPVLRVPLDCPEQLPAALSAVRFMYTGKLDVSDAASLLRVRRQAAYLQVEGGTGACEEALVELIAPTDGQTRQPQNQQQQATVSLAGVVQLYGCRELLASTEMEPAAVRKLLRVCRQQLVKHVASPGSRASLSAGGPTQGQLLAWALSDAPSLLSDPEARRQALALPASALEALLGCEDFATDDEASVLLLVLTWLQANEVAVPNARPRLVKLGRLVQLNETYLLRLLPLLRSCLGISPEELRFLQEYATATPIKRAHVREVAGKACDFQSPWYRTDSRPSPRELDAARSYEWSVDGAELRARISLPQQQQPKQQQRFPGKFASGVNRVVANGFEWYPEVTWKLGEDAAGVFLYGNLPACLGIDLAQEAPVSVHPGPCRLAVYRWGHSSGAGSGREEAWCMLFKEADFCRVSWGRGSGRALPLSGVSAAVAAQGPAAASAPNPGSSPQQPPQQPLATYLKDGKL